MSAPVVALEPASTPSLRDASEPPTADRSETEDTGPKIVSLDQFRKK
jgi:hypothetical protein